MKIEVGNLGRGCKQLALPRALNSLVLTLHSSDILLHS